ncbi:MAG: GntR family transcriptional regulator [Treponema sp.]|jgi:LacI family transcriptional regulator|nr:GntR family transcriptional regulator [Treponema sp.]
METIDKTGIDRTSSRPVFKQIYEIILSELRGGCYDGVDKIPSEKELCLRFDVERNTVRKALQILVDEKVITRVPGIGSRILPPSNAPDKPARKSAPKRFENQKRKSIVLITQVDYLHSIDGESFHYKLIQSFEKRLSQLGYNLLFKPVGQDGIVAETIRGVSPRGIIFDSFNQDSYYQEAAAFGLPCISINHYTPHFTSIVSNNFGGSYELVRRFADAGHSRIAFITGKNSHQTNEERLNGIHALCGVRGIPLKNEYCISGDWTFASGVEAAKKILDMKPQVRPTAVFAFNDDIAYGCYSVFQNQGLSVPDDISLAGFDKSDRYKALFPPITTVDVNLSAMVDYACWYITSGISGWVPQGSAKIQIDTTICDNGTIRTLL